MKNFIKNNSSIAAIIIIIIINVVMVCTIEIKQAVVLQTAEGEVCGCMIDDNPPSLLFCEGVGGGDVVTIIVSKCD